MGLRSRVLLTATGLTFVIAGASASLAPATGPFMCSGKLGTPGMLKGAYPNGVTVKGVCAVKDGKAHVFGTLTITKGSSLAAAFGHHHSSLTVTGNMVVGKGATVLLGCKALPDGNGMPCLDDPNMAHPTLTSHASVSGNITEHSPLGVIIHNSSIGGNITQSGGGGGVKCAPPSSGPFAKLMAPVFSALEDSSVGGNLTISGLKSCWLGLARDKVHGSVRINNNTMADPNAIGVFSLQIHKNLACSGNSHPTPAPPGAMPMWDSASTGATLFPRVSQPNTVGGTRSGQCVTASPTTLGGPPAASAF